MDFPQLIYFSSLSEALTFFNFHNRFRSSLFSSLPVSLPLCFYFFPLASPSPCSMLGRWVTKVFWWLLARGWLPDYILR